MTDEELVIAFKESEEKHWVGELYRRYAHLVLGLCMKYLKDEEKAKDECMEIFQSLFEKLLKSEVEHFRPWLYTVAKNSCLMQLRKAKIKTEFRELDLSSESDEELSLKILSEKKYELVESSLSQLKVEQAQCISAFYLEKKCYAQIAEENHMDVLSVKSHIQNGKRMIKIHLMKHPEFQ